MFDVLSLIQVFKRKQYFLWKTIRFSKRIFRERCYCPINWQNFSFLWKRTIHPRCIYWFAKGIWYGWSSHFTEKLKLYAISDINVAGFEGYSSNRKQYIQIGENSKTDLKYVTCGVPKGTILAPLLFLVYVNDLPNASCLLDPIIFAEDTNNFF